MNKFATSLICSSQLSLPLLRVQWHLCPQCVPKFSCCQLIRYIDAVCVQVWFDHPVEFNGLFVTTGFGPPSGDMSEWNAEASESNWSESFRSTHWFNMKLPTERGVVYFEDFNAEQPIALLVATNSLIFAAGFLLSVVFAVSGREAYVSGVLAGTFSLSTIMRIVSCVGYIVISNNVVLAYSISITTGQVNQACMVTLVSLCVIDDLEH
jgi:hypothetical protein